MITGILISALICYFIVAVFIAIRFGNSGVWLYNSGWCFCWVFISIFLFHDPVGASINGGAALGWFLMWFFFGGGKKWWKKLKKAVGEKVKALIRAMTKFVKEHQPQGIRIPVPISA